MPGEGVLSASNGAQARGGLCYRLLLGERSESLSGEARRALPGEGVLNPINC
jgi:hypothetical protein